MRMIVESYQDLLARSPIVLDRNGAKSGLHKHAVTEVVPRWQVKGNMDVHCAPVASQVGRVHPLVTSNSCSDLLKIVFTNSLFLTASLLYLCSVIFCTCLYFAYGFVMFVFSLHQFTPR